jgi:hypothetical protein
MQFHHMLAAGWRNRLFVVCGALGLTAVACGVAPNEAGTSGGQAINAGKLLFGGLRVRASAPVEVDGIDNGGATKTFKLPGSVAEVFNANGGADVFGEPVTPEACLIKQKLELAQIDEESGESVIAERDYYVLYTDRFRFEVHDLGNGDHEILGGRIAAEHFQGTLAEQSIYHGGPPAEGEPSLCVTDPAAYGEPYEGETVAVVGHKIHQDLLSHWTQHGLDLDRNGKGGDSYRENLMLRGYPMSPLCAYLPEDASTEGLPKLNQSIQVFERAAFVIDRDKDEDDPTRIRALDVGRLLWSSPAMEAVRNQPCFDPSELAPSEGRR